MFAVRNLVSICLQSSINNGFSKWPNTLQRIQYDIWLCMKTGWFQKHYVPYLTLFNMYTTSEGSLCSASSDYNKVMLLISLQTAMIIITLMLPHHQNNSVVVIVFTLTIIVLVLSSSPQRHQRVVIKNVFDFVSLTSSPCLQCRYRVVNIIVRPLCRRHHRVVNVIVSSMWSSSSSSSFLKSC